jgi:hypothetical protein
MAKPADRRSAAVRAASAREGRGEAPPDSAEASGSAVPPGGSVVAAAMAGLAGAWIAAGSAGLLSHPMRRGGALLAVGLVLLLAWPRREAGKPALREVLLVLGAALLAACLIASMPAPAQVLGVAIVLAAAALGRGGVEGRALVISAAAVALFGLYRAACTSIPAVWLAADVLGAVLSAAASAVVEIPFRLGARLAGGPHPGSLPLSFGPSMAGVDFLVPGLFLAIAVPLGRIGRAVRSPSKPSGRMPDWLGGLLLGLVAVLAAQLLYLVVLALAGAVLTQLPEPPPAPDTFVVGTPPPLGWTETFRRLVPWNVPALGVLLHVLAAGAILRQVRPAAPTEEASGRAAATPRAWPGWPAAAALVAAILALALPVVTVLSLHQPDLRGKKFVVYEKGFLNWLRPQHGDYGRLAIGMYGMLPDYLRTLGADCLISPELSEDDLLGADALVLLFPSEPWTEEQLERIWAFVEEGGTLLLAAEHTIRDEEGDNRSEGLLAWIRAKYPGAEVDERGSNRFNEVLAPTAIHVEFDSATFAVGGWLHSYETLGHPTTAGISDEQNEFGVVIGASLRVRPPARPFLIGRWGWSDPGDPLSTVAMMGNHRYDCGERLGDLILAAEQPLGKGRVIVFGDTSGFTNGLTIGCHTYTARLFGYAVDPGCSPQRTSRQVVGLLLAVPLGVLLAWRPCAWRIAAAGLALGASLVACNHLTAKAWEVLPDGRRQGLPNNLAYVDAAQMNAGSREGWRPDATMGLCMTLMRNGYVTLYLPELSAERLRRAKILVSVAPLRPYTRAERRIIQDFIEGGGIFIVTVGYEESGPSRQLLSELGFSVGEPMPIEEEDGDTPMPPDRVAGRPGPKPPPRAVMEESEPKPLGHFKSPYFNAGDYLAFVRFHSAWAVHSDDENFEPAQPIAFYPPDKAIITTRRYGTRFKKGRVVVVGDTGFAMNKNLEREGGQPFDGMYENAHFWRWFLVHLVGGRGVADGQPEPWYPPNPADPATWRPAMPPMPAVPQPPPETETEPEPPGRVMPQLPQLPSEESPTPSNDAPPPEADAASQPEGTP